MVELRPSPVTSSTSLFLALELLRFYSHPTTSNPLPAPKLFLVTSGRILIHPVLDIGGSSNPELIFSSITLGSTLLLKLLPKIRKITSNLSLSLKTVILPSSPLNLALALNPRTPLLMLLRLQRHALLSSRRMSTQ
jgi:hypothetical protein